MLAFISYDGAQLRENMGISFSGDEMARFRIEVVVFVLLSMAQHCAATRGEKSMNLSTTPMGNREDVQECRVLQLDLCRCRRPISTLRSASSYELFPTVAGGIRLYVTKGVQNLPTLKVNCLH